MRRIRFAAAPFVFGVLFVGCSTEDAPVNNPMGSTETVTAPLRPSGPDVVRINAERSFTSGGATSNEGHPVEYQFDFDADGLHDFTSWTRSALALKSWPDSGAVRVKVRARCETHPNIESVWSLGKPVEIGSGPDTEITGVINRYYVGGQEFSRILNITDNVPDTVPYGSWIQLLYRGIPSPLADTLCLDNINECLRYQVNYSWESVRNPGVVNTIAWRPFDPADDNPNGDVDSTTMNIGSVEYVVRARTVDQFDRADMTPAEVEIIGNFPPTLDTQSIKNYDGTTVNHQDTVFWDWWNPANAPDTIDTSIVTDVIVVKKFYFVAQATAHDHPMDPDDGVKSWEYKFLRVGSSPPSYEQFASRAGQFVDGTVPNVLADTAMVTFTYSATTDPGGASILSNLPGSLNREYEYSVVGRDLSILDRFDQIMYVSGDRQLLNSYFTAQYGRHTAEGRSNFFLKLVD